MNLCTLIFDWNYDMIRMKKTRLLYIVFAMVMIQCASVICEVANGAERTKAFLNIESILEGWEGNYSGIKTMQVSYTEQVLDCKAPDDNPLKFNNLTKFQHVERIEDGKRYRIRYSISEDGFEKPEDIMEHAFDGDITTEYWGRDNLGTIDRGLKNRDVETKNVLPQYMLSNTVRSTAFPKEYPQGLPHLVAILRTAISKSTSVVSPDLELIAGKSCHLLVIEGEFKDKPYKYKLWFAHENGMLPMKFQYYTDNILRRETEVKEVGVTETETGDLWYPKKANRNSYYENGQEIRYELTTHAFVPNVIVNKDTFKVDFVDGTRIADSILGLYYIKGVGDVDSVPIARELKSPKEEQPNAIAGTRNHTAKSSRKEVPSESARVQAKFNTPPSKVVIKESSNNDTFATKTIIVFLALIIPSSLCLLLWYKRYRKA